jgi:hypothetical protein
MVVSSVATVFTVTFVPHGTYARCSWIDKENISELHRLRQSKLDRFKVLEQKLVARLGFPVAVPAIWFFE